MSLKPQSAKFAIVCWLAFLAACVLIISRSQFTTDLSAFLPRDPTPAQQVLIEQITDGLASRLILVGIEGADAPTRAGISKAVAARLRSNPAFASVNNGEPVNVERDRAFLFNNRYLLSPAVTPERFSVEGLNAALSESIELLASPAGLLFKSLLPRDPTGEMVQLLAQFDSGSSPTIIDGVWASRDGQRALLLLRTRASGSDIDAQQTAMHAIRAAFNTTPGAADTHLVMTGSGVFSVTSRDTIKDQVTTLSLLSMLLIATLLLIVYRSVTTLALGFLPVVSGALAGVAAVSLAFGAVHGITLGFGTALIGEAVDYSIYLFVQSEQQGASNRQDWIKRFWPTIRLGVLTSICGFASLLLSGFPGLAQLGLYSIAGLVSAATVTRFVLPHLLPANFRIRDVSALGVFLSGLLRRASALRWPVVVVLAAACVVLVLHRDTLWDDNISSLSPVSRADTELDGKLRGDLGAPDVRYLIVVSGASQQAVLSDTERVSTVLQTLVDQGELASFESPSRYLPSLATQRARQASLPASDELESRMQQAVQGMPVRAPLFTPFLADVAAARQQPLLLAADLEQTSMALAIDALLLHNAQHWSALLSLTAVKGSDIKAEKIQAALKNSALPTVVFVDLKGETNRLYSGYLHEAVLLSFGGLLAIIALLFGVCRSLPRVVRLILPLAAAVLCVVGGLSLFGQSLILLHLVGLLLVVAVGSNYALFFDRAQDGAALSPRTLASMLLANLTTVAGFGLLAFSKVAILQAMGITVAPGVILALVFSAIFAKAGHA